MDRRIDEAYAPAWKSEIHRHRHPERGPSPAATVVAGSGTTPINLQSDTQVTGMSGDNTGLPFDWGYVGVGARLTYALQVSSAGTYALTVKYASPNGKTGVNIAVNGVAAGAASFGATGSWGTYASLQTAPIALPAGAVTLQLTAQSSGFNIGGLALSAVQVPPVIALANPASVNGFYHDATGQAFDWGYTAAGATISYVVTIATAQMFSLDILYASPGGGTGVNVLLNGTQVATVAFAATGSWGTYATATTPPLAFPAGSVTIELQAQRAGFNLGGITFMPSALTALPYQLGFIANDTTTGQDLATIQGWLGRKLDCCGGTMTLAGWWNGGVPHGIDVCGVCIPMLTQAGWNYSFTATDMAQAASGAYDQYYIAAAQALAASGASIRSVRPGWEMNGNWYPWSIGGPGGQNNTAANYIATFQRMVKIFRQFLPGVLIEFCTAWAWQPYTYATGSGVANAGTPDDYWPGAQYVDIVSMDFYQSNDGGNWATLQSGAQFDLDWLVSFAKQQNVLIGLSEWGAASDDGGFISAAAAWMNSLGPRFVYSVYSSYAPADQVIQAGSNPVEQAAWVKAWGNTCYQPGGPVSANSRLAVETCA